MNTTTDFRLPTAGGEFIGRFTELGLAELWFPDRHRGGLKAGTEIPVTDKILRKLVQATRLALESALAGGKNEVELPPFDWEGRTSFQKRVWTELLQIPAGQTRTYGEIAMAIGAPAATRAVGSACGSNPIPVLVPCHRVLAAGGALGGFSGGLEWKRRLLAIECPRVLRLIS